MTMPKLVSLTLLMLALTTFSFAQSAATGDLRVTVKDPKGSLLTNATVTARDLAKGLERSGTVNGEGEYRISLLPPGTYQVTIEAAGFAKVTADGVAITVGQVADLPVALAVAGTQVVVNVSAAAELVETSRTSTTDTIEQRRIDNLPINGRNYINFALTDSQVLRDNAPSIGAAPTSGLNMSGQRARANLVNVDGADAIDNSTNGVRSTVSQEAVQEFQIITNSYAAEYGRASGGVINIITRSGSNEFHGDVYGYLRNRYIQATNPFSNVPQPAYTRVQAGAAFGGPIKKDKTYYYFAYEITRRQETGFASIGQDGFGLTNFDATNIFFPPGLLGPKTVEIQVTPQQAAFLSTPGVPPALLQAICLSGRRFFGDRRERAVSAGVWPAGAVGRDSESGKPVSPIPQFLQPRQYALQRLAGFVPDVERAGGQLSDFRGNKSVLAAPRSQLQHQQSDHAARQRKPQHGDRY